MKQSPFVSLRALHFLYSEPERRISYRSGQAPRGNLIPKCHPEPFASCHSERVSRSPERSEGEESHTTQGELCEEPYPTEIASALYASQ